MSKKLEFKRRTGKIIVSGFENFLKYNLTEENLGYESDEYEESFYMRTIQAEQYLNDRVAIEIHKRFNIAVRFHL